MDNETQNLEREAEATRSSIVRTLEQVESKVRNKMEEMKATFDIKQKVSANPLAAVGGAVAAGVLAGVLLSRRGHSPEHASSESTFSEYEEDRSVTRDEFAPRRGENHRIRSFLHSLAANLEDEIHMAKGMAVGAGLGAVMRQVEQKAPNLTPYFRPILESVHQKTGYGKFPSGQSRTAASVPGDREETMDDGSWRPQAVK